MNNPFEGLQYLGELQGITETEPSGQQNLTVFAHTDGFSHQMVEIIRWQLIGIRHAIKAYKEPPFRLFIVVIETRDHISPDDRRLVIRFLKEQSIEPYVRLLDRDDPQEKRIRQDIAKSQAGLTFKSLLVVQWNRFGEG